MRKLAFYTVIGSIAFLVALIGKMRFDADASMVVARPPADAPDSVQLAAIGIRPGMQLVAYVFGGSRCGFCQKEETKAALASLRDRLTSLYLTSGEYKSLSIVGVAVDTDLSEGLEYLESIGPQAFTEISIGSGWQNEHIIRLLRREGVADLAVPLVIVIARPMVASLAPLTLTYGADSVVKVIQGSSRIEEWVRRGADLSSVTASAAAQLDARLDGTGERTQSPAERDGTRR